MPVPQPRLRHAVVAATAYSCHQRYLTQEFHVESLSEVLSAVFAEDEVFLIGVGGRREPRHIFHNTEKVHLQ